MRDRTQPMKKRAASLQYGGDRFRAASSFLCRAVPGAETEEERPDGAPLLAGVGAAVLMLRGLPTVHVSLSDSPAGLRLRRHFDDRKWGIRHSRIAQGVLRIPEEPGRYLSGRSRQALRTNIHKAKAAGIACRSLDRLDERRSAALHLRTRMPDMWRWADERFCQPGDAWWSARNGRREAVAVAQVTVDRECALLQTFVSSDRASRYLLHAALVEMLVARNVRYLAVSAPMAPLLEPSLQYWQRLLGFDVVHVSVRRAPLAADHRAVHAARLPAPVHRPHVAAQAEVPRASLGAPAS